MRSSHFSRKDFRSIDRIADDLAEVHSTVALRNLVQSLQEHIQTRGTSLSHFRCGEFVEVDYDVSLLRRDDDPHYDAFHRSGVFRVGQPSSAGCVTIADSNDNKAIVVDPRALTRIDQTLGRLVFDEAEEEVVADRAEEVGHPQATWLRHVCWVRENRRKLSKAGRLWLRVLQQAPSDTQEYMRGLATEPSYYPKPARKDFAGIRHATPTQYRRIQQTVRGYARRTKTDCEPLLTSLEYYRRSTYEEVSPMAFNPENSLRLGEVR